MLKLFEQLRALLLFVASNKLRAMWVFSIEIQTYGWIAMKFGTEVVLEGGRFKAVVWLSQHTLVIKVNLRPNTLFKTSFESSRAMPGNTD